MVHLVPAARQNEVFPVPYHADWLCWGRPHAELSSLAKMDRQAALAQRKAIADEATVEEYIIHLYLAYFDCCRSAHVLLCRRLLLESKQNLKRPRLKGEESSRRAIEDTGCVRPLFGLVALFFAEHETSNPAQIS